ncbi:MAG: metal ABC transporter substrate-binding protein [Clostridiales bacterium]|nr:metal ABC transporter substrate-binding protein [Clostridiales bacterium]
MKKILALVIALVLSLSLTSAFAAEKISVIATENPHAEVMELVKDDLAALGYELELTVVSDYVVENPATSAGDVMANFFQHVPYLAGYNAEVPEEEQLVAVIYTHFEPMAIYAGTKTSLDDIAEGDAIAVPNDPVNENRALLLLQNAGLIKLPEGTTLESTCTPMDIVENPYNLEIMELNAELIPGARADVAYAVINGNNATLVELIPNVDGLYVEAADSEAAKAYVNIVVVKPENAEAAWVKALEQVIYTQEVYDLIVNAGFAPTFVPADAAAETVEATEPAAE